LPLDASGNALTITNLERRLYDPMGVVASISSDARGLIVSQDGIYNIRATVNVGAAADLTDGDNIRMGLNMNGAFTTRLAQYVTPLSSLSNTYGVELTGDWTGPLTAGTTLSVSLASAALQDNNTLSVAAYDGWEGGRLAVARQATLVHVVPQ
jgi:hypothetical protein